MKIVIYNVFLGMCFFLISCTVGTPELTVRGVQTEEALSFLEEYQNGVKEKKRF